MTAFISYEIVVVFASITFSRVFVAIVFGNCFAFTLSSSIEEFAQITTNIQIGQIIGSTAFLTSIILSIEIRTFSNFRSISNTSSKVTIRISSNINTINSNISTTHSNISIIGISIKSISISASLTLSSNSNVWVRNTISNSGIRTISTTISQWYSSNITTRLGISIVGSEEEIGITSTTSILSTLYAISH